jgi:hypothetical protein
MDGMSEGSSVLPVMATAYRHRAPDATREAPPVIVWIKLSRRGACRLEVGDTFLRNTPPGIASIDTLVRHTHDPEDPVSRSEAAGP